MTIPVGTAGQTAHGALITSLTSQDVPGVNPVVDTPTIDLSASTPEAPVGATAWPARPASITSFQAPYGQAQSLVLVPGQFMGSPTGGTGTQRLYNALGLKVYYAPSSNTDFDPATILSTEGTSAGADVTFNVTTNDGGGTVKRVLVAFHDFDGTWKFVDLAHGAGDLWTGTTNASRAFADGEQVEYFVQVLDAAANVAFVSNKAQNYAAGILDTSRADDHGLGHACGERLRLDRRRVGDGDLHVHGRRLRDRRGRLPDAGARDHRRRERDRRNGPRPGREHRIDRGHGRSSTAPPRRSPPRSRRAAGQRRLRDGHRSPAPTRPPASTPRAARRRSR